MTDDELQRIAELHVDGDPAVLAELRRDLEAAAALDALDRVALELRRLRD